MEPGTDDERVARGFLTDKRGLPCAYRRCEYQDSCDWFLEDEAGWRIGYAYTRFDRGILRLMDIAVEDCLKRPKPWLLQLLGFKGRPVSYRGRGLGSALLQAVIVWGRDRGFREMVGDIFPKDYGQNPRLPEWYARHGFVFTAASSDAGIVGTVQLVLAVRRLK